MFLAAAGRRAEAITHLNELAAPFTSHEAVSDAYQGQALVHGAVANFIAGRAKIAKRQLGSVRFNALYGPIADALRELGTIGFEHIRSPEGQTIIDTLHGKGAGGFAQFLRAYARTLDRPEEIPLSPAEVAVLRALDAGRRPKTIAEMSKKSVETIRSQIKSAIRKLGVSGQTEAVAAARRRGLLS